MNIAFDIDGTISKMPEFFAILSRAVKKDGGKVIIITSRTKSSEVESVTRAELDDYGIEYDDLFIISDDKSQQVPCPHEELDWYQVYLWQKVYIASNNNINLIFEDDQKVIDLFKKYAQEIQVFQVR